MGWSARTEAKCQGTSFDAGRQRRLIVLSPSHTWLAAAYLILTFGLVKASALWRTRQGPLSARLRWADVPLLIGLGLLLRTLAWFLTYVSPLTADYATGGAKVGGLDGYAGIAWLDHARAQQRALRVRTAGEDLRALEQARVLRGLGGDAADAGSRLDHRWQQRFVDLEEAQDLGRPAA